MRFADGAVRPGLNARIAAAPKEGVIVSIEVTDRRTTRALPADGQRCRPPLRKAPEKLLIDTSYATSDDIVALASHPAGR